MARQRVDSIDQVLEHVYAAALDPDGWARVLERMAELFGAQSAMMFIADWRSGTCAANVMVRHRIDPDAERRWQAGYQAHDVWSEAMRDLPGGFVTTGAAVVDPRALRRSPIYSDIIAKLGWTDVLSASLVRAGGAEAPISFYGGDGLYQRSHVALLERLAPHLRRALQLQLQISTLQQRITALEEVAARVAVGLLTLASDGTVVWASRQAETMLDQRDGLSLRDGRLACARRSEHALLEAAIGAAADGGSASTGHTVSISRPSGRRPYGLLVAPLHADNEPATIFAAATTRRAAVLVTVSDPEQRVEVLPERLSRLLGLTPAEARLAAALAAGCTLREYADTAGTTMNTARWTLKQVLAKTGCRRQSELVRLVLAIAAGAGA